MDYFNLTAECQGLSSYTAKTMQLLTSINSLLSDYSRMKEQLLKNMKISLKNIITEIKKPINSLYILRYVSSLEKNLKKIINYLEEVFAKESRENDLLQSEIVSPLNSFIKHINNQNILLFNEFNSCIDEIYKQKKKYDLSKDNYINCGKQITILAEKLNSLGNDNSYEAKELSSELNSYKNKFQKYYIEYKDNVTSTNKLYEEKNKEYFSYMLKLKETEDSKETFINFYFEKFDNFLKNKIKTLSNFENGINEMIPNPENEKQLKIKWREEFSNQLNNFVIDKEKQIRIKNEEFIDYDTYKKQLSALINQNRMYLREDTKNNRINFNPQEILINTIDSTSISSSKKSNEEYIFNQEENLLIENIFLLEEIDTFKTEKLITKIKNNFEYAQNLIDKVLERYTSSIGVHILNENNFIKFAKIINGVLSNKEIQKNLFEINFAIIYIAEKTFYQKADNPFYKRYLCKLLSELNQDIKSKEYWLKLLSIRIQITLEEEANIRTKKILKEERKKKLFEEKNKQNNQNTDSNEVNKDKGKNPNDKRRKSAIVEKNKKNNFFGMGLVGMVGNLFGKDNSPSSLEEKERKEKEALRRKEIFNDIYNKISNEVALRMIKDFIVHFSCFCVESYDVIDIISDITTKFKIVGEEQRIKYFVAIFNSNMYSIKNTKFKIISEYLDDNKTHISKFMNKNYLQGKNKTLILLNVMKYLPITDYKNIIIVNKSFFNSTINIVYSNLLINVDENIPEEYIKRNPIPNVWKNPELRLKIWKYLLHFKNDINYKQLIIDIHKKENHIESFDLIEMDVKRMWFEENPEEIRKSLNNILCGLTFLHQKIGYSQGMNCIASLLYDVCGSEEEAFNIFNCLLISTDYGDLYFNDLKRLNKYFYVFERLIFIYLPEVYLHLISTKISPKFFISPWFITLFTNAYKSIKGKGKPKVLIWIIDSFIIGGWRAINKIGLCLMKHFEKKILNMDTDELLHFLINDIINYDFFKNENYEGLRIIYDNLQIENGLLENIENEYEIKNIIIENNNNTNNNNENNNNKM